MTLSHKDLLLLILSDERWHSTAEILRRHPMMVHSRVSDLRIKDGHHIEHRTVGPGAWGSEYRLRSLSGRAEPRAGALTGSPAGDRMTPSECGYRDAARPLSDQPLTEEKAGSARASSRETSRADSDGRATTLVTEMSQGASFSVSDRPLMKEAGDRSSSASGGWSRVGNAGSPASFVSDRPLTPKGDGKSGLHGGSFSPSDVSGPVSPGAADDPLSPAPAAHLPAPAPWLQESLPVPGQLKLTEEAA